MPQDETRRCESIANRIVNLDSRIYSCVLWRNSNGAIRDEASKKEMQTNLGPLSQRTGGMVGHWGNIAFKDMERLDLLRTKTKYIVIGREKYNALIFPVEFEKDLMIAVTFRRRQTPERFFRR